MRQMASIIAFLAILGCTESNFFVPPLVLEHPLDNKITVSGGFCAEGANDLESFLKIMFIIDRSNSMQVTDPNNRRIEAVADVVNQFIENPLTLEMRAGVEIALISFWGDVATHTRNHLGLPGFSNDGPQILSSLVRIAETSSNTGYDKALSSAFQILDNDMARMSDVARARSRYDIFFLSDGMPFPDNCSDESNSLRTAVRGAGRIRALQAAHKLKDGAVSFHTAFASAPGMFNLHIELDECECLGVDADPVEVATGGCSSNPNNNPTVGDVTRELLRQMAIQGEGTFKQFENGDAINFLEFDFAESRRLYALSYFVASNLNARAAYDHSVPDSDADGLTDAEEIDLGTSPFHADTDGDGFGDGIEHRFRLTGLDALDPTDVKCEGLDRTDTDSDGLLDCEERFLGTVRRSYDSDSDGVPDPVEILASADANSATPLQDHQTDSDADGGNNAEELRWHTDPKRDDVGERAEIAYDYFQSELPITTGQACYDFEVRNVTLASTVGAPSERSKGFCVVESAATCDYSHDCGTGLACDLIHGVCHEPKAAWCYDNGDCPGGQVCDNFTHQDGWNRIMFYMAQTPYDDPLAEPIFRLACVEGRYIEERDLKIPANGRVQLPLRRPSDTFRASPVLSPNKVACHVSNNQDCGLDSIWCHFNDDGTCAGCNVPSGLDNNMNGLPHPTYATSCPPCADGIDNDGDGFTDYPYDPDCFDALADNEEPDDQCSDGIDNDGDGRIDFPNDPGCIDGVDDNDETDPATPPECADGIDNDAKGAIDYPHDPGCYAASDATEVFSERNPIRDCNDGVDNDGDGSIDFVDTNGDGFADSPGDSGCTDLNDIDEEGPAVCYFCQQVTDYVPGQCSIKTGHCRSRAGLLPGSQACTAHSECRGSICDQTTGSPTRGQCVRCLADSDCDAITGAGSGLCDTTEGWCLQPLIPNQIQACTGDGDCAAGPCDTDLGYCAIDPYHGCRTNKDCADDELCSKERGFCLKSVYQTHQCNPASDCLEGECDEDAGWCLPTREEHQCKHDDECPFGDCLDNGSCDQQTFVFPENFRPEVDCIRQE